MPVNWGNFGSINTGGDKMWRVNCALCTAAAVVMRGTGKSCTTADVSCTLVASPTNQSPTTFVTWRTTHNQCKSFNPETDDETAKALTNQIEGVLEFCYGKLQPCTYKTLGTVSELASLSDALKWMKQRNSRTHFAVFYSAEFAHWNYAHLVDGEVEFIDYQTDRAGLVDAKPTASPYPVLAYRNLERLTRGQDPLDFENLQSRDAELKGGESGLVVLAFCRKWYTSLLDW